MGTSSKGYFRVIAVKHLTKKDKNGKQVEVVHYQGVRSKRKVQ